MSNISGTVMIPIVFTDLNTYIPMGLPPGSMKNPCKRCYGIGYESFSTLPDDVGSPVGNICTQCKGTGEEPELINGHKVTASERAKQWRLDNPERAKKGRRRNQWIARGIRKEDLDKADPAQVVRNVAAVHAFVICGE